MSPVRIISDDIDFSDLLWVDTSVDASPAAAAETIIATLTVAITLRQSQEVLLAAWAPFTVGTNGTAATLRIRRTNASGTVVATTGALTVTAANLVAPVALGVDSQTSEVTNQVYVATLQVTNGSAASTVSAVTLAALAL